MTQMNELRRVLGGHAARYPRMRPADAVKLIYQNEFGGGHLIADPAGSLRRLREEWASVSHDAAAPLVEDIGNGMVRIMLNALEAAEYPLEQLNRDFVRSAARHRGDRAAFREKINTLRALTAEGIFEFSSAELSAYLDDYLAAGCPAVSHSAAYRAAYAPAYRVIERRASLPLLLREVSALSERRNRVLVAVDGRCASGKSTLAARLSQRFGWGVLHMDDFFLRPEQRTPERCAAPGENVDHERFLEEVLLPLRRGVLREYRPFDCRSLRLAEPVRYEPARVTLIEGSYACHPSLRAYYDLHVFLTVDAAEQLRRIEARNGAEGLRVFRERWIPLEEAYFAACDVENACEYALELPDPEGSPL